MTMPITALFGGLLVLLCAGMSLTMGLTRANNGVMFGSGGKADMEYKVRAQGSCLEYSTLVILAISIAEANEVPAFLLYVLGWVLVVARCSHVFQLWDPKRPKIFRLAGFLTTIAGLTVLSVINIAYGLSYYRP